METVETPTVIPGDLETSVTIGSIAEALAAAQAEIDNAAADAANPHFGSSYADLASIVNACRLPLAKAKIARYQSVCVRNGEIGVRTALIHSTGEFLAFTLWCKADRPGPQALGSVITYLRRYSLAAAVGVGQEDDDGEAGMGRERPQQQKAAPPARQQAKEPPKADAQKAEKPADPPKDPEHEKTLKRLRDVIGKDLGWEAKKATAWFKDVFGVDNSAKLSPLQAPLALTLALAADLGDDRYNEELAKLRATLPALFRQEAAA